MLHGSKRGSRGHYNVRPWGGREYYVLAISYREATKCAA
jgi:hypothetical protein